MNSVGFIFHNMIKALTHLCIFSYNLQRSRDFYCGVLGLEPHFEFFKEEKLFGFYLKVAPRQFIEIFSADAAAEARHQHIHHFCLEVEDMDAVSEKLTRHDIAVTPKKLGCDQTWQCWCKDPDGTDIEFQQYTPQSSQFTRTDCIVNW